MSELAKEGVWIRYLLEGLNYKGQDIDPITLFGDNQGALLLAENPTFYYRSKYIAIVKNRGLGGLVSAPDRGLGTTGNCIFVSMAT